MSNKSIIQRIGKSIEDFKAERIDIRTLKESIRLNGRALEMMPFSMVKELEEIDYKLMVAQFMVEEDCRPDMEEIITLLEAWMEKVPVESET